MQNKRFCLKIVNAFSDNLRIITIGAFGPYSKHRFTTLPLVLLHLYLVADLGFAKSVGLMETLILK